MTLFSSRTLLRSTLLAVVASTAACATDDGTATPVDFTADHGGGEATASVGRVVATLTSPDGATFTFFDESAPGEAPSIGVEIGNSTETPSTDRLLEDEPTALELFMALAPAGKAAPEALIRDHELTVGTAPRQLAVASVDGQSLDPYSCHLTATWASAFSAWAPVLDGQYIAYNENGYHTGYVGYAPKFYFDVCRPWDLAAGLGPYYTGVQRRTSSSGTWTTINGNTGALNYQQRRWRYYHNTSTCSSYQYRLVTSSPGPNRYHRAARWADEWSCTIGL